jgi:glycerol-3-phosphate acyltransferase PlsY
MTLLFAVLALASYLLGSIPTSFLAARYGAGIDLRTVGSRNLGATNLFRVLGWRYAIPVVILDAAKGAIPVLLFASIADRGPVAAMLLGLAAIIGHVFSVFVRFKGGKGVATSAGAVMGLAPLAFLVTLVVFTITVRLSGYASLGSILGAVAFPIAVRVIQPSSDEVFWFGVILFVLITAFHHANIRRLLSGTESRIGQIQKPAAIENEAGASGGGPA